MKYNFIGTIDEVNNGLEILSKRLGFQIDEEGKTIKVTKRPGDIEVISSGDFIEINYDKKIHFFRALGLALENAGESFHIVEKPKFKTNGIMIDASRNAVMKVEKIKDFIEIMALMGLNLIMMYTEDTYEVSEYPYFGYMRGRYTYDELHECDEYADIFGIEMIPCIQTLGHFTRALKWNHGVNIKDTNDILLVGEEDTYKFIKDIMTAATRPYRSNRIHIGMDETHALGMGSYLKKHGYRKHQEIMREHLIKVKEIVDELGLEAIIWGDMFVARRSEKGDCYDMKADIPENSYKEVPEGMKIVYWDYYHEKKEEYDKLIKIYKNFDENLIFAGGIWTWGRMNLNYRKTVASTVSALKACIENGIDEVFATMWGDDGNQTNIYEALYGMQIYAEIGYGYEAEENHLEKRFKTCTGEKAKAFLDLELADDFGQKPKFSYAPNPSEYMLWQDILIGLLDKHIPYGVAEKYAGLRGVYKKNKEESALCQKVFEYAENLANVLEIKADLGVRLKKYYDEKNKEKLKEICEKDFVELTERLMQFKWVYMDLWMSTYKAFGWEEIDKRFGFILTRIDTAKYRIGEYLKGNIEKIEELEEERLYFRTVGAPEIKDLSVSAKGYRNYVSVSSF